MALQMTFRELAPQLEAEGLAEAGAVERALREHDAQGTTPWFVQLLTGVGAWVAAGFLIGFVSAGVFGLGDRAIGLLGLACCAAAIVVRRRSEGVFSTQLALAVGLAGQGMVIGAVGEILHNIDFSSSGAWATLALSLLMLALNPDRVQAFLSSAAGALAALFLVRKLELPVVSDLALLALAVLTHAALLERVRLLRGALGARSKAIAAGLVTALLLALLLRSVDAAYRTLWDAPPNPVRGVALTLGLGVLLWHTVRSALRESGAREPGSALLVAGVAVALLAALTLQTPGVMGAAGVMALAFHRRSPVLLGTAIAFALCAGVAHYYDLSLTLLEKSGALVGSGLLLLGLRLLLLRRFPEDAR